MKKILAFILCITMVIPCAMLSTFAQESNTIESGKVLYYQTFGESFKGNTLADAGMTNVTTTDGVTAIDETSGYLSSKVTSGKKTSIVTLPDVLPHQTYTIELTFRFKKNNSGVARGNAHILVGFDYDNFSDTNSGTGRAGMIYSKDGYYYDGSNTKFTKSTGLDDVLDAWAVNGEYGEWATMTVAVKDDILYKMTLSCGNTTWESTDVIADYENLELNSNILYIYNYQAGLDFSSIRVVEGVDYTEYTGKYADQPGYDIYVEPSEPEYTGERGEVLYQQVFAAGNGVDSFAKAGLEKGTPTNGDCYIDKNSGYLMTDAVNNRVDTMVILPDVLTQDTYTVEIVFRFRYRNTNDKRASAGIVLGFNGENPIYSGETNQAPKTTEMLTVKYDNFSSWSFDTTVSNDELVAVENEWLMGENDTCGDWIKMTVAVRYDKLYKMSLSCNGQTWESDVPTAKDVLNTTQLYIANYQAGLDISSIKVVEGVDYTENDIHGQFATKSYSDFYNTDVISTGIQPSVITSQEIRLVAEIKGLNFKAAGFRVSITYTDDNADNPTAPITKSNDMVAHCAYLSLSARGENNEIASIEPKNGGDYLIAIAIEGIEERYTITSVTFTPYAINADGHTYIGETYTYNYTTQSVVAQ